MARSGFIGYINRERGARTRPVRSADVAGWPGRVSSRFTPAMDEATAGESPAGERPPQRQSHSHERPRARLGDQHAFNPKRGLAVGIGPRQRRIGKIGSANPKLVNRQMEGVNPVAQQIRTFPGNRRKQGGFGEDFSIRRTGAPEDCDGVIHSVRKTFYGVGKIGVVIGGSNGESAPDVVGLKVKVSNRR